MGQEASAARCVPADPPSTVRQVGPDDLDWYQNLVEQHGRPSPPTGTPGSGHRAPHGGTSPGAADDTAGDDEPAAEDAAETAPEPEFADAESGEMPVANGPVQVLENGSSVASLETEPEAEEPVALLSGEDASPVLDSVPR